MAERIPGSGWGQNGTASAWGTNNPTVVGPGTAAAAVAPLPQQYTTNSYGQTVPYNNQPAPYANVAQPGWDSRITPMWEDETPSQRGWGQNETTVGAVPSGWAQVATPVVPGWDSNDVPTWANSPPRGDYQAGAGTILPPSASSTTQYGRGSAASSYYQPAPPTALPTPSYTMDSRNTFVPSPTVTQAAELRRELARDAAARDALNRATMERDTSQRNAVINSEILARNSNQQPIASSADMRRSRARPAPVPTTRPTPPTVLTYPTVPMVETLSTTGAVVMRPAPVLAPPKAKPAPPPDSPGLYQEAQAGARGLSDTEAMERALALSRAAAPPPSFVGSPEDEQLQLALARSLSELSTMTEDELLERALLESRIVHQSTAEAVDSRLQDARELRAMQDSEFEATRLADLAAQQQRVQKELAAAREAEVAAALAEQTLLRLREKVESDAEVARLAAINRASRSPPISQFDTTQVESNQLITITLQTPSGRRNYTYYELEPIGTLYMQAQYDMETNGAVQIINRASGIPTPISCDVNMPLKACGVMNRTVLVANTL